MSGIARETGREKPGDCDGKPRRQHPWMKSNDAPISGNGGDHDDGQNQPPDAENSGCAWNSVCSHGTMADHGALRKRREPCLPHYHPPNQDWESWEDPKPNKKRTWSVDTNECHPKGSRGPKSEGLFKLKWKCLVDFFRCLVDLPNFSFAGGTTAAFRKGKSNQIEVDLSLHYSYNLSSCNYYSVWSKIIPVLVASLGSSSPRVHRPGQHLPPICSNMMLWCQPTVMQRGNARIVWPLTVEECLQRSVMGFAQIGAGGINLTGQVEVEHIHD